MRKKTTPTLLQSVTPIIFLIILIGLNVWIIGEDTLSGANQLSLLLAATVGTIISLYNGIRWSEIIGAITHSIAAILPALIILLMIGMISGMWMISGIIPTMIYYGLDVLHPYFFLPATVIISAIISILTGSSWSTIATVGIALLGIGSAMGFNESIIAGAIISGAYFGDKISPLSDTTNLAAATAGTPLFTHIRYMLYTTIPTIAITLILFIILTFTQTTNGNIDDAQVVQEAISNTFNTSIILFAVPVIIVILIAKKIPAIAALLIGSLCGAICALLFQMPLLESLSSEGVISFKEGYRIITRGMFTTSNIETNNPTVSALLTTHGMAGMINTVWLIICAMIFGGVLEAGHFLSRITRSIISKVHSTSGLVTTTAGTALLFNIAAGDQYMSIVIPGKMFSKSFLHKGLRPEVLSRTLEDSATVTSVLIPWNTCGATQSAILGVSTLNYLPYTFFCYISPIMTLVFAFFSINIRKYTPTEMSEIEAKTSSERLYKENIVQ